MTHCAEIDLELTSPDETAWTGLVETGEDEAWDAAADDGLGDEPIWHFDGNA